MKKFLALFLCLLLSGCAIGIHLGTPEDTAASWIRSFNDRDYKGIYLTLSSEYVANNGGEEKVKADIKAMLEDAEKKNITYKIKAIGHLAMFKEDYQPPEGEDTLLVRLDKTYIENGEKKAEEIILNFKVRKENGEYKILDYWD